MVFVVGEDWLGKNVSFFLLAIITLLEYYYNFNNIFFTPCRVFSFVPLFSTLSRILSGRVKSPVVWAKLNSFDKLQRTWYKFLMKVRNWTYQWVTFGRLTIYFHFTYFPIFFFYQEETVYSCNFQTTNITSLFVRNTYEIICRKVIREIWFTKQCEEFSFTKQVKIAKFTFSAIVLWLWRMFELLLRLFPFKEKFPQEVILPHASYLCFLAIF